MDPDPRGLPVIFSGPSGVGKTTICHQVVRRVGGIMSVSMTTRPRSAGDVEGVDYHFVDAATFQRQRDQGQMLEWAQVFGHYYGTPRQAVLKALDAGRIIVLEIDVQGAIQVKRHLPAALAIFVEPPGEAVLLERLRSRKREDEAVIQHRFAKTKQEIATARSCGVYDRFIVNDNLERAIDQAIELIKDRWRQQGQAAAGQRPGGPEEGPGRR